jgi:hypothetical protein
MHHSSCVLSIFPMSLFFTCIYPCIACCWRGKRTIRHGAELSIEFTSHQLFKTSNHHYLPMTAYVNQNCTSFQNDPKCHRPAPQ